MLNSKVIIDILKLGLDHGLGLEIKNEIVEIIESRYKEKDWDGVFIMFESQLRFPLFLEIYQELNDEKYFSIL